MKVKLLKKVRERFSITYYPKGVTINSQLHDEPLILVYDKVDKVVIKIVIIQRYDFVTRQRKDITIESAKAEAYKELRWAITRTFHKHGTRRIAEKKKQDAREKIQWEREQAKIKLEQNLAKENIWYNKK